MSLLISQIFSMLSNNPPQSQAVAIYLPNK